MTTHTIFVTIIFICLIVISIYILKPSNKPLSAYSIEFRGKDLSNYKSYIETCKNLKRQVIRMREYIFNRISNHFNVIESSQFDMTPELAEELAKAVTASPMDAPHLFNISGIPDSIDAGGKSRYYEVCLLKGTVASRDQCYKLTIPCRGVDKLNTKGHSLATPSLCAGNDHVMNPTADMMTQALYANQSNPEEPNFVFETVDGQANGRRIATRGGVKSSKGEPWETDDFQMMVLRAQEYIREIRAGDGDYESPETKSVEWDAELIQRVDAIQLALQALENDLDNRIDARFHDTLHSFLPDWEELLHSVDNTNQAYEDLVSSLFNDDTGFFHTDNIDYSHLRDSYVIPELDKVKRDIDISINDVSGALSTLQSQHDTSYNNLTIDITDTSDNLTDFQTNVNTRFGVIEGNIDASFTAFSNDINTALQSQLSSVSQTIDDVTSAIIPYTEFRDDIRKTYLSSHLASHHDE